jgi:hypothetical protein
MSHNLADPAAVACCSLETWFGVEYPGLQRRQMRLDRSSRKMTRKRHIATDRDSKWRAFVQPSWQSKDRRRLGQLTSLERRGWGDGIEPGGRGFNIHDPRQTQGQPGTDETAGFKSANEKHCEALDDNKVDRFVQPE